MADMSKGALETLKAVKETKNIYKDLVKLNEQIKKLQEDKLALEKASEAAVKREASQSSGLVIDFEKRAKLAEEFNKTTEELNKTTEELVKLEKEQLKLSKEILATTNSLGENVEEISTGFSHIGKMAKSNPRNLRESARSAGDWAERMQEMHSNASKLPGKLNAAAKAAGGMAKMVGGISKLLLGVPGVILMGVKTLIDASIQMDSYLKNLNKRYAAIRGPQIMTKDVDKQFVEFNRMLVSFSDNIRDGLNSDQVYDFMTSITEAGGQLNTLNQGFYSYRDAVHIAAKASKNLGVDVVTTGAMMGEMLTNMRMDMKGIDKAFVEIAFNAEKSGMSTDRFWGAVKNATASLAFYGKFLKETATMTKVLGESQMMGADQAAATAEEVTQAFKKMDTGTAMSFIQLAGGAQKFSGVFKKIQDQANEQVEDIKQQIVLKEATAKTPEDVKAIEDLKTKLINAQSKSDRLAKAASGDIFAQGQELAMASGETPGLLFDLLKGVSNGANLTKLSGEKLEQIIQAVDGVTKGAIGKDTVRYWVQMAQDSALNLKYAAQNLDFDKVTQSDQKAVLKSLDTLNKDSSTEDINAIAQTLQDTYGITAKEAKDMAFAAANSPKMLTATKNLLSSTDKNRSEALKAYDALVTSTEAGVSVTKSQMKDQTADSKDTQAAYDDTFQKIRDNTLSIEDMKGIAGDAIKYNIASYSRLSDISTGVSRLVTHFMGKELDKESAKKAAAAMESIKNDFPELAKQIQGMDPAASIVVLQKNMKITQEQLARLDNVNASIVQLSDVKDFETKRQELMDKKVANKKDPKNNEFTLDDAALLKSLDDMAAAMNKDMALRKAKGEKWGIEQKAKKEGRELTKDEKAQIKAIDKQTDKLLKKGFGESKSVAIDANQEAADKQKKLLTDNTQVIENLKSVDASAETTAQLMEVSTLSDPNKLKTMLKYMQQKSGKEITKDVASKFGAVGDAIWEMGKQQKTIRTTYSSGASYSGFPIGSTSTDLLNLEELEKKASQAAYDWKPPATPKSPETSKPPVPPAPKKSEKDAKGVTENQKKPVGKAGLKEPETVTQAGAVILHPGETILPTKYMDFQTQAAAEPKPVKDFPVKKDFEVPEWFKRIDKLEIKKPAKEKTGAKKGPEKNLAINIDVQAPKATKETPKTAPLITDKEITKSDYEKSLKKSSDRLQKEVEDLAAKIKIKEAAGIKTPEDAAAIKDLKSKLLDKQDQVANMPITISDDSWALINKALNQQTLDLMSSDKNIADKQKPVVKVEELKNKPEPVTKPGPAPIFNVEESRKKEAPELPKKSTSEIAILKAFEAYKPRKEVSDQPVVMPEVPYPKPGMMMMDTATQIKDMMSQIGSIVPKETILPPDYDAFKTTPMVMAPEKDSDTKTPPPQQNISITVNANEKDLAQRIANEVRGVLYKEQVNNRG